MMSALSTTNMASRIEWPGVMHYIPCMAIIKLLAIGAFMSSHCVKGPTKCRKAHECNQQCAENESIDIGNSQRLPKAGHARINNLSAMSPG
jgi:hypothetical protein